MNDRRRLSENDGDHVESDLVPRDTSSRGIAAGSTRDVFAFVLVDLKGRGAVAWAVGLSSCQ